MERNLLIIIVGVFGLVVGSFLNVCIYRIPLSINIAKGRSFCPKCKNSLNALDLFPVFSFIFLGGKCRYCKEKISPRYPVIELLNAALWAGTAFLYGKSIDTIIYCLFFSVLIVASMIDFDIQEVPYKFQLMILALGIISLSIHKFDNWADKLIGAVIISIPMIIITLLTGGFGGADYMIMAVSGFLLGVEKIVVAAFIGIIFGAIYGIFIMATRKKEDEDVVEVVEVVESDTLDESQSEADDAVHAVDVAEIETAESSDVKTADETVEDEPKGTKIPFVPCLALGMAVAFFWGEQIAQIYKNLFNI